MYDLELNTIKRIKNGDVNAFEEIVDKYKDKALSLSMRILKNQEDAEDSLQDAFVKTFRAIIDNQFEERSKFSTYFYKIVYNTAIDNYKKLKSKNYITINIDSSVKADGKEYDDVELSNFEMKIDENLYTASKVYNTENKVMESEIQGLVNKFLSEIPEKYSIILTMFYINDLSHEEISNALNIPIGTVKNRIFRAKEKLKEIMLRKYPLENILEFV